VSHVIIMPAKTGRYQFADMLKEARQWW